jgi:hypothetical protein
MVVKLKPSIRNFHHDVTDNKMTTGERTNNDTQSTAQKAKDRTPLKTRGER